MPKKTTTPRVRRQSGKPARAVNQKPASKHGRRQAEYDYVYHGQTPTHVIVPVEDYERLLLAEMVLESEGKPEDESVAWVDLDDLLYREAGQRIAAARKAHGMTQTELGKKLGVAQTQVSRIERNPDSTALGTLKKIAKALSVDVRDLLG